MFMSPRTQSMPISRAIFGQELGMVQRQVQRQANRASDFGQPISNARDQVSVPVSSINAPKTFFTRLESPRTISAGYTPLATISVFVPAEFNVLSFVAAFSFVGNSPSQAASQLAATTSRNAVKAIAYAQTNPAQDAAANVLDIAIKTGVMASVVEAEFSISDPASGDLASSSASAPISKSASGAIVFQRRFTPGVHVFTLGCSTTGSISINARNTALYIQQLNA